MFWRALTIAMLLFHSATGCSSTRPASGTVASPAFYDEPILLFVSPDDAALERMKDELGDDFYTVADDAMWYRSQAYELAGQYGIPCEPIDANEARFRIEGELQVFSWAEEEPAWLIVFYDGVRMPKVLYDIDLPAEMETMLKRMESQGGEA